MKKGIRIFVIGMMVLSLACSAYAATGSFVASITAKPAPELVVSPGTTENVVVEVLDGNNEKVEQFDAAAVVITPVAQKDAAAAEDPVKTVLTEIYEQLSAPEVRLSEVMPELTEVVKTAAVEDASLKNLDVDKLVVKDLFHVAATEEITKALETEGNFLKLTFAPKLAENQHFFVMVCVDGQWLPVDYVLNADGTVTCSFHVMGTVAFLVSAEV